MSKGTKLLTATCALLLATVGACSQSNRADTSAADGTPSSGQAPEVLWLGDSVAAQLAKPLTSAAKASELPFKSIAAAGGGNVSGREKLTQSTFQRLNKALDSYSPDVVTYQVSTYDWGTEKEQRAAYEKLLQTVADSGAKLAIVTMPPIKPDDFYKDHMDELDRTTRLVEEVAASSDGKAVVFDSTQVWGEEFQKKRDGELYRKSDGIHTCPQGAAQFTDWMLEKLAKQFGGFTPTKPESWADAGWSGDSEFEGCQTKA
ncbi:SGNH/GDSL hydrolase family protein [Actinopolyspora sp. H202]|uniref:SGNH/GDSL hydrolase family protein n=1 Tax=Actinopolyspora sp. H202 TaxID=1500456 RepID=UPI003EE761FE